MGCEDLTSNLHVSASVVSSVSGLTVHLIQYSCTVLERCVNCNMLTHSLIHHWQYTASMHTSATTASSFLIQATNVRVDAPP